MLRAHPGRGAGAWGCFLNEANRSGLPLLTDQLQSADPCVKAMTEETEEGKKVARGGGKKYVAVFRRKADAEIAADSLFW